MSGIEGKTGVAVEILCETDFVARTDAFKDFCKYVARTAMAMDADGDISEKLAAATEEEMKVLIGKLGENMHVRRAVRWTTNGIIKEYLGRYWNVGPQLTLYAPAPLLKKGRNEVVVFEQHAMGEAGVESVAKRDFGVSVPMKLP